MDKRAQLLDLTRRLRTAANASDWPALRVIDRELAHLLRWMRLSGSDQERAAFEELRRAHAEAREQCDREAARLDEVLAHMRTHRDGWMAYALSGSHESDLDQAWR